MDPIRFIVYSDYLCPWCWNASLRLRRLEDEYAGRIEFEWRSYLLRPRPQTNRDLEKFRAYSQSWLRPAAEDDGGDFVVWEGDAGPPSHSIPPHLVAKAAARLGREAFRRMHDRLMRAYFHESRDITDAETLRELWHELSLPAGALAAAEEPALLREVLEQHREALESGATGVPAVRLDGNPAVIVGAQPESLYRRWIERTAAARAESREGQGAS